MKFTELGLDNRLIEGIEAFGFEEATPIQEQAIPAIIAGRDIIGSAQTGTGKTAAFLLPIIHKIITEGKGHFLKALIIVPTRELAMQIDQQLEGLSYYTPISSLAIYGGTGGEYFVQEKKALSKGVDIVIGTPGRLIAHFSMDYVNTSELSFLVLDEADRMLDMGFHDDIMRIISYLSEKKQNLLFAATMPPDIRKLSKKVLNDPVEINIAISKPAEKILQVAYVVYDKQKNPLVKYLLSGKQLRSILIFCSTKNSTKQLSNELKKSGLRADEIHSDLEQKTREEVLRKFKNRDIRILIATDILSRGIDIENIDLIINYDVPNDVEDYIHRIGRTARAESDGVAISLIDVAGQKRFANIEKLLNKPVMKLRLPKELGDSPEYNPGKFKKKGRRR